METFNHGLGTKALFSVNQFGDKLGILLRMFPQTNTHPSSLSCVIAASIQGNPVLASFHAISFSSSLSHGICLQRSRKSTAGTKQAQEPSLRPMHKR